MQAFTTKDKINFSNAKAIRRSRELLKVTRKELAHRLGLSAKAIEKYENGKAIIDEEKIRKILEALNLSPEDFNKIKRGKGIGLLRKKKTILTNGGSELYALDWGDIDDKNGIIRVSKSFCKRSKSVKCPKNGLWRNVDISPQLHELIQELRVVRGNEKSVLPNFPVWKNGDAPKVLRLFLDDIGLTKQIVFHTLRACFATHLLGMGVDASKVMRMGGWSDLKTFQIYLRLAGVDVKGITAGYDVLPGADAFQNVVPLFSQ